MLWIVPTNIENACQTINPGILIIQPHAGSLKNKPASNVNSIHLQICYRTNADQALMLK